MECPESKENYMKTHQLVEKFSKILRVVLVYVTIPCFVLPPAFLCFYTYFTTDSGADAFKLPAPMW